MNAQFNAQSGLLTVNTSIGVFTEEFNDITDSWMDIGKEHDLNVFEQDGEYFCTLFSINPNFLETGESGELIEECKLDIIN